MTMTNATEAKRPTAEPKIRAYSTGGFSKAFSIGRSKLFEMLRKGEIQSVLIGGKRIIPADEGERLINPNAGTTRERCEDAY
jgi:hypothetical protein